MDLRGHISKGGEGKDGEDRVGTWKGKKG